MLQKHSNTLGKLLQQHCKCATVGELISASMRRDAKVPSADLASQTHHASQTHTAMHPYNFGTLCTRLWRDRPATKSVQHMQALHTCNAYA